MRFYFRGVQCEERIKLPPTPANLKYCERWKARMEDEIAKGQFNYANHFPDSPRAKRFTAQGADILLSDLLTQWLERARGHLKHSTQTVYASIIEGRLIPAFGHLTLQEFHLSHVKAWAAEQTASRLVILNTLSCLQVALAEAVEDELIPQHPLAGWKLKRSEKPRQRPLIDPFSTEERTAILAALEHPQVRNLVQAMFWTGMRPSELIALEWPDIDWERGIVAIVRARTQGAPAPETPKTAAGKREIKLLRPAREALRAQEAYTLDAGGVIFHNPHTDAPWAGAKTIRERFWIAALRRAGVRYRRMYQTRHTYASLLLMAGEDVRWVSQQLGHRDWAFTAKTYTRFIPDDAPHVGNRAEALYQV